MMRDFAYSFELLFYWRYPACSAAAQKRIDQSVTVMDLTNCSMSSFNS